MNDQQRTAQIYGQRLRRRAPAKPTPPAPEPTPQSCGWTKAPIGAYWTRGPFGVHTVTVTAYTGDGIADRYYEITRHTDHAVIGRAIDWANVERIADRRSGTDRRRPR